MNTQSTIRRLHRWIGMAGLAIAFAALPTPRTPAAPEHGTPFYVAASTNDAGSTGPANIAASTDDDDYTASHRSIKQS